MTISVLPDVTVVFLLMFARLGSLVMLMPGVGEELVPTTLRLTLALLLTLVFYPLEAARFPTGLSGDMQKMLFMLFAELVTGIGLGLLARMLMSASQVAGTVIGFQLGLSFATSVDPAQGQQDVTISTFMNIAAMTLVFVTDLHHLAIRGIAESYDIFRPGSMLPIGDLAHSAVDTVSGMFSVALQIAAPFLIFGAIMSLALGLLSKLLPQMQVYFVLNPAVILIGLVLFAFLIRSIMTTDLDYIAHGLDVFRAS